MWLTYLSLVALFSAFVAQATRSQTAGEKTHADEDENNWSNNTCYNHKSVKAWKRGSPPKKESKQCFHIFLKVTLWIMIKHLVMRKRKTGGHKFGQLACSSVKCSFLLLQQYLLLHLPQQYFSHNFRSWYLSCESVYEVQRWAVKHID